MINYFKKIYTKLLLPLFLFVLWFSFTSYAADDIWTGWTVFESGSEGWGQAGGDGGHAYGKYQFDIGYDFVNFLNFCLSNNSEVYSPFQKFVSMSQITKQTDRMENKPLLNAREELSSVWKQICSEQGESFYQLQTDFAAGLYYYPVKSKLLSVYGINLDDYGAALKGTVWSIAVRDGNNVSRNSVYNNLRAVTDGYKVGISEEEWLNKIYDLETQRHPSQSKRWHVEQRAAALDVLRGGTGEVFGVSDSGNIFGVEHSYDGSVYTDYVAEWINKYPELSKDFKNSGGWNVGNITWCESLRGREKDKITGNYKYVLDFYEMYGIQGGGLLDFTAGVSGGSYIGGVVINAETYQIPENGSNNPIVYFGQSNGAGGGAWAGLPFGGQNIGYSGCSVTSLAMVVSYLNGGVNKNEWTYPNDVVKMIADKTGNYNHFYVGGAGQSWDIFPNVAKWYGISCSQISSSSIVNSLTSGKPVIMSCKPGEFTSTGHFIVITGVDSDGYCYVNDPSHPDKSYKKYSASYLASQGKGWWSFGNQ